jgi:hypothetical protein
MVWRQQDGITFITSNARNRADTEKAIEIVMKLKDEGKISFKGLDLDNKEEIFKEKNKSYRN